MRLAPLFDFTDQGLLPGRQRVFLIFPGSVDQPASIQALQRDLTSLAAAGFATRSVTPIDMFPQTCHVESLACLELRR